jgi:uncharacterized membrane protein
MIKQRYVNFIGLSVPFHIQIITAISAVVLFVCSSIRHFLFQSTAFDLGWFDQAIYLISQGEPPIVSFSGFHILGDHAAFIFYPIALLYRIYPDVHWLFAVQAIALSLGTILTWQLAKQAGLDQKIATGIAIAYILYPLVFNINLFDFHSEVIAIPAILGAVWAARSNRIFLFLSLVLLTLSCKAVLSLTIVAFGFWLLLLEKQYKYGSLALGLGISWFLISTQVIFPFFTGHEHAAVGRYSYLGNSVLEIALNLLKEPQVVFRHAISWQTVEYLVLLFVPVIWGLSRFHLAPLIPIVPQLVLNLLSDASTQRDLIHQYSVPILPFLILAVIAALADGKAWLKTQKSIVIWSAISFVALAKPGYFWTRYIEQLDTWQATRNAVHLVTTSGSVLTTANIAPHLSHRKVINQTLKEMALDDLEKFDYVLLNQRHPGWGSSPELVQDLMSRLNASPQFQMQYQENDVYLFVQASKV